MPIQYRTGDATAPEGAGPRIIVHVCNDAGGWGRGFVLSISKRWPQPEASYRRWAAHELAQPFALGEVQLVEVEPDLWIANLIGQHGTRNVDGVAPVRYEAIRAGLRAVGDIATTKAATVHMPRIGAGLAGGNWQEVERIVDDELVARGVSVTVYNLPLS